MNESLSLSKCNTNKSLFIITPHGFCFGVERAIKIAKDALTEYEDVYFNHELVHNKDVNDELKALGARFDSPNENSVVLISAHGTDPKYIKEVQEKHQVIDTTCPLVKKIYKAVDTHKKNGYSIIIIGHEEHQEVMGIKGYANENCVVLSDINKIPALDRDKKYFVVSQTTFNFDKIQTIEKYLKKNYSNVEIMISVCNATKDRQEALRNFDKNIDLIVVVGDRRSSNSNRLKEIASEKAASILVENYKQLPKDIKKYNNIALTAGASTPKSTIDKCINVIINNGFKIET